MHRLRRLIDRLAHSITPTRTDTLIGAGLALLAVFEALVAQLAETEHWSWAGSSLLGIPLAGAVAWRRRRPFESAAAFAAIGTATALLGLAVNGRDPSNDLPAMAGVASLVMGYSIIRYGTGWQRWAAWGWMLGSGVVMAWASTTDGVPWGPIASNAIAWTGLGAFGLAFQFRADLRAERDEQARTGEREQLARELHDVVAHHVSAMVVQASAALAVLDKQPDAARPALQFIKTSGQQTMGEMRQMVGILRGSDQAELAPRGGIAGLGELLAAGPTGVPVRLGHHGEPGAVEQAVDQSVHRIVQEAVTNARRHGRGAAAIDVDLTWAADRLDVQVANDGAHALAPGPAEGGFGLVGMAERVRLLGGTFSAGPRTGGGWLVRASLPLDGARAQPPDEDPT